MQFGTRQRLSRQLVVVCAVLSGGLLLGGCTQPDPKPIPAGPPSAVAPVFASDEEALAAAEAGYQAYLDAWNEIAMEGGVDPERILPFVAAENQAETLEGLAKFTDQGVRNSAGILVDSVRLQAYREVVEGIAEVKIYACLDLTSIRLIDADGVDATPVGRQDRIPGQFTLISSAKDSTSLIFGGDESWQGENFCLLQ